MRASTHEVAIKYIECTSAGSPESELARARARVTRKSDQHFCARTISTARITECVARSGVGSVESE